MKYILYFLSEILRVMNEVYIYIFLSKVVYQMSCCEGRGGEGRGRGHEL
jgi:hypothetical protein